MMHKIDDWLVLHGLDNHWPWQEALENVLQARATPASKSAYAGESPNKVTSDTGISANSAWAMSAESMRAFYPDGEEAIGLAERHCVRDFTPNDDRGAVPYTIPNDKLRQLFVRVSYRRRASDLLATAHEFGHAVQAIACDFRFVPPVLRETTAFLSELALLQNVCNTRPLLYPGMQAAWLAGNRTYLDEDGPKLLCALRTPNAAYQYRLNYPLARLASTSAHSRLPASLRWEVFKNNLPLHALVGGPQAMLIDSFAPFVADCPAAAANLSRYRGMGTAVHRCLTQGSDTAGYALRDFWDSFQRKPELEPVLDSDSSPDTVDFFAALGMCLELLATSRYHCGFRVDHYFDVEILPALIRNQMRLYLSPSGRADALVTWAWLSTGIHSQVRATGRTLKSDEWTCGAQLFLKDGIARNGSLSAVSYDLTHNVFPDQAATSLCWSRPPVRTTAIPAGRWS